VSEEQKVEETRMVITTRLPKGVHLKFKSLCHSHRLSVENGLEAAVRAALRRAGVEVEEHGNAAETVVDAAENAFETVEEMPRQLGPCCHLVLGVHFFGGRSPTTRERERLLLCAIILNSAFWVDDLVNCIICNVVRMILVRHAYRRLTPVVPLGLGPTRYDSSSQAATWCHIDLHWPRVMWRCTNAPDRTSQFPVASAEEISSRGSGIHLCQCSGRLTGYWC